MTKQHRSVSEILTGMFILFSAIALSLFMLRQLTVGQRDILETLPVFGFCLVLILAAFAQITGTKTFLQTAWLIIGIGLSGLGVTVACKWSVPGILAVWETENWQETPCIVLTSEVLSEKKADGTVHRPNIRYTYNIDGHSYKSDIADVFWISVNGGMNAQEIVNMFPAGITAVCWVNPKNNHASSLQRGWQPMHFAAFLPLILIVPGLAVMTAAFWGKKHRKPPPLPKT